MAQMIGNSIGAYIIDSALPLGSGGIGQVFRATPQGGGPLVALKLLHPQYAGDKKLVERFQREAALLRQWRHPNIVEVYDAGDLQGQPYLVMELMPQGSLFGLMQRRSSRSWPLSLGIDLMLQAAEGLAYAHAQGVVHRDVKPANMLLRKLVAPQANPQALLTSLLTNTPVPTDDERYELKVADFGVAHLANRSQMTSTGGVLGTPAYMSPEQCRGKAVDARSDIYALGAVLYEIATGAPSVDVESASAAIYNILMDTPTPPRVLNPALPAVVEAIILRCLEKDPDQRYQTMAELAADLRAALVLPEVARAGVVPTPRPTMRLGSASILITPDRLSLSLTPGQPTTLDVAIRNLGNQIDHYDLLVEGVPGAWLTLQPPVLQIDPNKSGSAQLQILVPRSAANRAADYTVTIRARSQRDPSKEGVAQMSWSVLPFAGGDLALSPQIVRGARRGRYIIQLHNDGNTPARYILDAEDSQRTLVYSISQAGQPLDPQQGLSLEPGQQLALDLEVRARSHWVGIPRTHAFNLSLSGADQPRQASAQFIQRPLLSAWLATAVPIFVLLLLALLLSPPLFWDVTSEPLRPGDDEPVAVSWRIFNVSRYELRPKQPGFTPIALQAHGLRDWLGLVDRSHRFDQGFSQKTELELVAWNLFGISSAVRPMVIDVNIARPVIDLFSASASELTYGEPLTVTLSVRKAERITLEPGGISIPVASGGITTEHTLTIIPTSTTAYQLIAVNGGEQNTQELGPVVVTPRIDAFAVVGASEELITGAEATTHVRWKVAGAMSVEILANGAIVHSTTLPTGDAVIPAPLVTTEYLLKASSADGAQSTEILSVAVRAPVCNVVVASAGVHAAPFDDINVIGQLTSGDKVRPLERMPDMRWLLVDRADPSLRGWVDQAAVSCDIRLDRVAQAEVVPTAVPTYTPVPTNTPTPTLTPTQPIGGGDGGGSGGSGSTGGGGETTVFRVSQALARVTPQSSNRCPVELKFTGEISVEGAGTVRYQWEFSDGDILGPFELTFGASGARAADGATWTISKISGTYSAKLRILSPTSGASNSTTATATVTCEPPLLPNALAVPITTAAVILDGDCTEYRDGVRQEFIDYNSEVAEVYLVHDRTNLYVCAIFPKGVFDQRFVDVYLSPGNQTSGFADADDYALDIFLLSGNRRSRIGTGNSNYDPSSGPDGWWKAVTKVGPRLESAEYSISIQQFGLGSCGNPFRIAVFHKWNRQTGDDWGWPSSQWYDQPGTWQLAQLANAPCR